MLHDMALRTFDIFAGTGMLGEGLRTGLRYLGGETRTACYIEREAYAAALLVARMQDGSLDDAPIWADITTFDASAWRGAVDCVVAGFPCQDLSVAGRRAGLDGKRSGLFFDILKIATDCGAQWMFLENVAGIASAKASVVDEGEELDERAASRVVGALADSGWNAEWLTLRASDVGASHSRARWFCFAWLADSSRQSRSESRRRLCSKSARSGGELVHPGREQRQPGHKQNRPGGAARGEHEKKHRTGDTGNQLGNTTNPRLQEPGCAGQRKLCAESGCGLHDRPQQPSLGLFAPGPSDSTWPSLLAGYPDIAPAIEPGFCRMVDGVATPVDRHRQHRLRAAGNGVVALQAATAFVELFRRLNGDSRR